MSSAPTSTPWSSARTRTDASCSRSWSAPSASDSHDPNGYGMMSGGTSPSTRSITKNGEPMAAGSSSNHKVRGTGTRVCSPTSRMTRNWRSRSYTGNTGAASGSGISLAAQAWVTVSPRIRRPRRARWPRRARSRSTCRWTRAPRARTLRGPCTFVGQPRHQPPVQLVAVSGGGPGPWRRLGRGVVSAGVGRRHMCTAFGTGSAFGMGSAVGMCSAVGRCHVSIPGATDSHPVKPEGS